VNNERPIDIPTAKRFEVITTSAPACAIDAQGHCVTCSDEARAFTVLRVNEGTGTAAVSVNDIDYIDEVLDQAEEEVDITLVDDVVPGDVLLVHGGVAIALLAHVEQSSIDEMSEASDA
jgi:hydrogenase maturation factor